MTTLDDPSAHTTRPQRGKSRRDTSALQNQRRWAEEADDAETAPLRLTKHVLDRTATDGSAMRQRPRGIRIFRSRDELRTLDDLLPVDVDGIILRARLARAPTRGPSPATPQLPDLAPHAFKASLDLLTGPELSYADAEAAAEALVLTCIENGAHPLLSLLAEALPRITTRQNLLHLLDALVNYDVHPIPSPLADGIQDWMRHDDDLVFVSTARCLALCTTDGLAKLEAFQPLSEVRARMRDDILQSIRREQSNG